MTGYNPAVYGNLRPMVFYRGGRRQAALPKGGEFLPGKVEEGKAVAEEVA